jgi:hypothetical protein
LINKYIIIFIFSICFKIMAEDPQIYLQPSNITGEWIRVIEAPSDVPGLYRKDTLIYQIGLDSLQDLVYDVNKSLYKPLAFKIIYQRGGNKFGYLHDPNENYDWDREESSLQYHLELGLPEQLSEFDITFSIPKGYSPDTLRVTCDLEVFGLKKKRYDDVRKRLLY